MVSYQVIEPSPLHQLQLNYTSSLYEIYIPLLKTLSKQEAILHASQYCLTHPPEKLEDQIAYLEFLYMNDFFKEVDILIHTNNLDSRLIYLYRLLLERLNSKPSKVQSQSLQQEEFLHPSLQCLHLFTIIYHYYDLKEYTGLDKYLEQIDEAMNAVNEPLTLYYMKIRYNELLFQHYWKTNNPLLAKKYAYKITNTELSPKKICRVYHNLALCNVFTDYQTSMEQAVKACEVAEKYSLERFAEIIKIHTIPFIAAYHLQTEKVTTPDPVETAHLAIADRDFTKAIRILENLERWTPFQECYMGAASKNAHLLENAHHRFIHELGDQFFAILPKHYLKRL
ncbi:AimR family lysis-lysogeny pheromone receptor [Halobacillus sp. K22]|uniref:AimR family lysis-lysogeny pheromone receptor n=1 Tax=Halobacillus sp. K22 TaxID=3457431 RepID=UPI003FCE28CC